VCEHLKADEQTKDIPIIFMTALSDVGDKVRAFKIGGVDYITKPIQHEEVLARVQTHLQIRQQARQLQQQYQELEFLAQQLAHTNANKDKFFSIVAHDLKGPFMPLMGNLELLSELGDSMTPPQVKELGQSAQRSAKQVFNLLENLLTWARLQMGRLEYQPEPLDLATVAQQTVDVLGEVAEMKGIQLLNEVKSGVMVYVDGNMLDTVIRNLTNNALKFTSKGGQVTIAAQEHRPQTADQRVEGRRQTVDTNTSTSYLLLSTHYVEVSIADTGVGMPEHVKEKLFKIDEHVSTVGTGKETGTGLGLIICQEMVVKSGGRIWVESEVGKGTTVRFTVRLDSSGVQNNEPLSDMFIVVI
jgi:signal transduction histidine kinase